MTQCRQTTPTTTRNRYIDGPAVLLAIHKTCTRDCKLDDFRASPAVKLLQAFTSMQQEALPAGIMDAPLAGSDALGTGSDMQQLPVYASPYAGRRAASRAEQEAAAENASELQSEELAGQLQQVLQLP